MDLPQEDFSGIPTVVLESLRIRLSQLVHSQNSLNAGILSSQLPPWPSLHQQFNVALLQLESVVSNLEATPEATQRAVVFPMASFPTASMHGLLTTLLRKKALPEVEAWIKEGNSLLEREEIDFEKDDEFCDWAWECAEEITQIRVAPLQFSAPVSANGWPLDKIVEFMSGQ